jgi:hypothetical protein
MSAPRWNANEIIKFLELYETYELLWNFRHKDYLNKNRRELSFETLVLELREQEFESTDVELVRKKLKTIKTVYRQELSKITKSKKSIADTDDLYKPKFQKSDSFLRGVTATRTSTSTLVSIFKTCLYSFQISFKIRDKKVILICFPIIAKLYHPIYVYYENKVHI